MPHSTEYIIPFKFKIALEAVRHLSTNTHYHLLVTHNFISNPQNSKTYTVTRKYCHYYY